MKKLLVIDTSYLIFRSYFAYPSLSQDGQHTGALFGFIKTVMSLIDDYKPDNIVFAKDTPSPTWRHQLYTEYKAGRPKPDEQMIAQIPIISSWIDMVSKNSFEQPGFEADDIIYSFTLAKDADNEFYTKDLPESDEVLVFSSDKDLYQSFINPKVKFIKASKFGKTELFTLQDFTNTHELEPIQWLDYKALVGDNSDNLKGLSGVGPKTATKILKEIKHIKYLLEAIGLDSSNFTATLEKPKNLDDFLTNPKNAKIITQIQDNITPLTQTYILAKLQPVQGIRYNSEKFDMAQGLEIYQKYNFQTILNKYQAKQEIESQNSLF